MGAPGSSVLYKTFCLGLSDFQDFVWEYTPGICVFCVVLRHLSDSQKKQAPGFADRSLLGFVLFKIFCFLQLLFGTDFISISIDFYS